MLKSAKKLTAYSATMLVITMIIGSGLFILPKLILNQVGPINTLLGWVIIICLMIPFVHIFSRLGAHMPSIDGIAKYAEVLFGRSGNIYVSFIIFGGLLVGMPTFFIMTGEFIANMLGLSSGSYSLIISISLAFISTTINIINKNLLTHLNKYILLQVFIMIFILIFFSFYHSGTLQSETQQLFELKNFSINKTWLAASTAFWAFQGWESLSHNLHEFKSPEKNIRKAYWVGFLIVSIIYLFYTVAEISSLLFPNIQLGHGSIPNIITSNIASLIFLALALSVIFSNSNSWTYAASRANYSFAAKGILPSFLRKTNSKNVSTYLFVSQFFVYTAIILSVYYFNISIENLILMSTQCFMLLYGVATLAFIKKFKKTPDQIIGATSLILWGAIIAGFSWYLLYPLSLLLIGILFYRWKLRRTAAAIRPRYDV